MNEDELKNALRLQQAELTTLKSEVSQLKRTMNETLHELAKVDTLDAFRKSTDERIKRVADAVHIVKSSLEHFENNTASLDRAEHRAKIKSLEKSMCEAIEGLRNRIALLERDESAAKFIALQKKFNSSQKKINKAQVKAYERLDAAVSNIEAVLRGDCPVESHGSEHPEERLLSWLCEPQVANPERLKEQIQ